jgi:hypothetical protein
VLFRSGKVMRGELLVSGNGVSVVTNVLWEGNGRGAVGQWELG